MPHGAQAHERFVVARREGLPTDPDHADGTRGARFLLVVLVNRRALVAQNWLNRRMEMGERWAYRVRPKSLGSAVRQGEGVRRPRQDGLGHERMARPCDPRRSRQPHRLAERLGQARRVGARPLLCLLLQAACSPLRHLRHCCPSSGTGRSRRSRRGGATADRFRFDGQSRPSYIKLVAAVSLPISQTTV